MAYHTGDIDYIDFFNQRLALNIPLLVDHSQRGNLNFTYSLRYAATVEWDENYIGGAYAYQWGPANNKINSPFLSMDGNLLLGVAYVFGCNGGACTTSYYASDENGQTHYLATNVNGGSGTCGFESADGSGILWNCNGILVNRQGVQFHQQGGTSTFPANVQDPNGNRLTFSCTSGSGACNTPGNVIKMTDSVGRFWWHYWGGGNTALCPGSPVRADLWQVPGPNGTLRNFTFCYSTVHVLTAFGASGVEEYQAFPQLITAVVLPDGTTWQFTYDNYGDITNVRLPTGGSIAYTWITNGPGRGVISRTRSDGTTSSQWTYNGSIGSPTTTVTDPLLNDTVYTPVDNTNLDCDNRITQEKHYQGSAGGGNLLETLNYGYQVLDDPYPLDAGGCGVAFLPASTTTTNNANQVTQVSTTYDTGFSYTDQNGNTAHHSVYGLPQQTINYDYGNGALGPALKTTNTVYKALSTDSNASSYLSANVLSLANSQTVLNGGGTQAAQTTYAYDESNGSVCTTQPCGDLTSVTRWLNGGTSPKSQYKYNSNGMLTTKCDPIDLPCSNPTLYTYNGAYLSQIQYPTAGVAHFRHFVFDSNTGLMTQSTDENGTSNPTNYSWDCMLRPLSITYPDGGQEGVTYNYSGGTGCSTATGLTYTGATQTKKINASLTLSQSSIYDGLGRLLHTQLTSDPEGTDYTDTTYDLNGRVYSVTNPYRSTSDSTYGLTKYQYDSLNRVTTVIESDLSAISTSYSGKCATVTDEVVHQQTSCTDGLQRLTEVDEPSAPAAAPSSGSGTATVPTNDSEKSTTNSGSASAGPKAVGQGTDSGIGPDGYSDDVWSNPNNITLNNSNSPASIYLDCSDNAGGLSNYLLAKSFGFNLPSSTLSINGIQVTFTREETSGGQVYDNSIEIVKGGVIGGTDHTAYAAWGYSYSQVSFGSSTDLWGLPWSYTDINSSGFGAALSSSVGPVCGGTANVISVTTTVWYTTPAGTTYDSGTVWVTVNGAPQMSATYGQGDTPTSVASKLAASINGNGSSPVTASLPQGSTSITLTAKSTGPSSNYSLVSGSSSSNGFSPPSFGVSVSGSSLSGGYDAGGALTASTFYQYDALDNLTRVDQKNGDSNSADWRTRTFSYDSLSRLRCAANPEIAIVVCPSPDPVPDNVAYTQGTIGYGYDPNSNLLHKTDARGITITFAYDALNRLTQKSYSDGLTATVKYGYDAIAPTGCSPSLTMLNPIGQRTAMCDAAGIEAWSYERMGRPVTDQRTSNAVTKSTGYGYNLDGSILSMTYPSGRTITYTPSAAARMLSAVDTANGVNYATSALYTSGGALRSATNGTAHVYDYFNLRLQPCRFAVNTSGTTPTSCADTNKGNVLDVTYNFGLGADNGNVLGITNNITAGRSLTAAYDALNRIESAYMGTSWSEQYGIDLWGNLTTITNMPGKPAGETLTQGATTQNRFAGMSYDAAGNLLNDGSTAYAFDAESRIKTAGTATYLYDGDGKRVEKSTSSGVYKIYWYGMGSDPLDETDGTGSLTNTAFNEYVFFNGKRIARRNSASNVFYYFTDHLGTSREIVQAGQTLPCYDADFYPFGREQMVYTNTCPQNYKFTGKERDETTLDNFGARHDSSQYGRFMSPDPVGGIRTDPQTLNRYSYVRNSPLTVVDRDGLYACEDDDNLCATKNDRNFGNALLELRFSGLQGAAIAANFGSAKEENGITVDFKSASDMGVGVLGATDFTAHRNENGSIGNIQIKVNLLNGLKGRDLLQTVAHEGSHVQDDLRFFLSFDFSSNKFNSALNFYHYDTEFKAFEIGAMMKPYQNLDCSGGQGTVACGNIVPGPHGYSNLDRYLTTNPQYRKTNNELQFDPKMWPQ